jgi:hypothetical protein
MGELAVPWCDPLAAATRMLATSGRVYSMGGSCPARSSSRTRDPLSVTQASPSWGQVLVVAMPWHRRQ